MLGVLGVESRSERVLQLLSGGPLTAVVRQHRGENRCRERDYDRGDVVPVHDGIVGPSSSMTMWPSGEALVCKTRYAGSNPVVVSTPSTVGSRGRALGSQLLLITADRPV